MKIPDQGNYFIAGLAIGLGVVVLFAPRSGTKTVSALRQKAVDGINSIKAKLHNEGPAASTA